MKNFFLILLLSALCLAQTKMYIKKNNNQVDSIPISEISKITFTDTGTNSAESKIVYISNEAGNDDVWIMNIDGTMRTRLTTTSEAEYGPTFTPDGKKIIYVAVVNGTAEIWIMNVNGSNQSKLIGAAGYHYGDPDVSSDGQILYYYRSITGSGCAPCGTVEIFRSNVDGTNPVQLTNNNYGDMSPFVSPNGQKITYTRRENPSDCCNQTDVYLMNSNGSSPQVIISTPGVYDWGVGGWSHDGSKIIFTTNSSLYVANSDGTNKILLATNSSGARYNKDDSKLFYHNTAGLGGADIWVMNADGSNKHSVLSTQYAEILGDIYEGATLLSR